MFKDKLNSQTDSWSKGKFGPDYKKLKTGLSWGTPGISWLAFQRGGGAPEIWLKHHTLVQVVHEAQQPVFNIVVAQLPRTGTHLSKYTARFLPLTPSPERRWRTLGAMREPVLQSSFFSLSVQIAAYQLDPAAQCTVPHETTLNLKYLTPSTALHQFQPLSMSENMSGPLYFMMKSWCLNG